MFFSFKGPLVGLPAFFYNRFGVKINILFFRFLEILLYDYLKEAERVLDVGTGPGHFPIIIGRIYNNLEIYGIDPADNMISEAMRNLKKSGLKNIHFLKGDSARIDFPSEYFDVVTSNFSIKHWENQKEGLKEIFRVLKKGGIVWIVDVSKNFDPKMLYDFIPLVSFGYKILFFPVLKFFMPKIGISADEMNNLISGIGFRGSFRDSPYLPFTYALLKKP